MKKGLRDDDGGQFLVLSAFIVAIGMVILLVLLNQSFMAGSSSSGSVLTFPKNDIREFRGETVNETFYLACAQNSLVNVNGSVRLKNFNDTFDLYVAGLKDAYAQKGAYVNAWYYGMVNDSTVEKYQLLDNVTLLLYYNNGETRFNETYVVNIR